MKHEVLTDEKVKDFNLSVVHCILPWVPTELQDCNLGTMILCTCYSVVGLVLPRGEEQISGPSALSKLKKPSKRSQKGPMSCQKYSKLCYDHFGGRLEASNPPPLFPLQESEAYWTVSSFFLLHRISFHQAHSISHFLANHISAEQKVGLMAEVWQN